MVWVVLYLDECTQRCYSLVWAYDYTVCMPWSYGKSRTLSPSSHRISVFPQFPLFSNWCIVVTYLAGMTILSWSPNPFSNPESLLQMLYKFKFQSTCGLKPALKSGEISGSILFSSLKIQGFRGHMTTISLGEPWNWGTRPPVGRAFSPLPDDIMCLGLGRSIKAAGGEPGAQRTDVLCRAPGPCARGSRASPADPRARDGE